MNEEYILFFDSGIGGLTTLKATRELLNNENFLYVADDKNCPYGNLTASEIEEKVNNLLKQVLKEKKVKLIVFACNTVTTCLVEKLRAKYSVFIVGTEPAILPAMRESANKRILVLATNATFMQNRYKNLASSANGEVVSHAFKDLAKNIEDSLVKNMPFDKEEVINEVKGMMQKFDADCLVLGCTHYCYLKDDFKRKNIKVYDGNEGVAKRVKQILSKENLLCSSLRCGKLEFILTSGEQEKVKKYQEIYKRL